MVKYEDYSQSYIDLDQCITFDGIEEILEEIEFSGVVVDIGCGYAGYLNSIQPRWEQFIGIEPNHFFREKARKNAEHLSNCTFLEGVAEDLPLQDNSVDTILTICAFSEIDSVEIVQKAMNEIQRIAKPGSRLFFIDVTGGQKDDYYNLVNTVEVLQGRKPGRNITDVWIEVLSALNTWGRIQRQERTNIIYNFATPEQAIDQLSAIMPDLRTDMKLRDKVKEIFTPCEFICEALFLEVLIEIKK